LAKKYLKNKNKGKLDDFLVEFFKNIVVKCKNTRNYVCIVNAL